MEGIRFNDEQIREILSQLVLEEDGYQRLMKMSLEALMLGERSLHNKETGDVSNGYRLRKTFGKGKLLELRVPRSRQGNFYPYILSILKEQEEESRRLAFSLYGSGLTCEQVSKIFEELYGKEYSTSQISRLFEYARDEVKTWLSRSLEPYYPMIYIDAVQIFTRRSESVIKESYYTVLGVRSDRSREVLGIYNFPTESASGWEEVFSCLKERGVKEINLVVCDGLTGIENAIHKYYSSANIQLCTVHLERNLQKYVRPKDKKAVSEDFGEVFKKGDSSYNKNQAKKAWIAFCNKWGKKYPSIGKKADDPRMEFYFTYLNYDYRIQSMIHSTNWIERLNRDYRRTTRMRGALPNTDAAILLLGYVAMNKDNYLKKVPRLDYENKKFLWTD